MITPIFCRLCGTKLNPANSFCSGCGTKQDVNMSIISSKSGLVTFLFCLFLGQFGIHRFYVGKRRTGVLMLFTVGGLGLWYLYDLLSIVRNKFTDRNGYS